MSILKVSDIIKFMDEIAPFYLIENWDNSGLQIGDISWKVKKIAIALDPSLSVIADAIDKSADMLIVHHPLFFNKLDKIDLSNNLGIIIQKAIQSKLAIFSAHTNLDCAKDGLNDFLAQKINLKNLKVMHIASNAKSDKEGFGRFGTLSKSMSVEKIAKKIKDIFGASYLKIVGDRKRKVKKVALCSGSSGSLLQTFLNSDADLYIGGDFKYHDAQDTIASSKSLVDLGHFYSEKIAIELVYNKLFKLCNKTKTDVKLVKINLEENPFYLI